MHCYEYLVMHTILKHELNRLSPEYSWSDFEIGEVLDDLNVNSVESLEQAKRHVYRHNLYIEKTAPPMAAHA